MASSSSPEFDFASTWMSGSRMASDVPDLVLDPPFHPYPQVDYERADRDRGHHNAIRELDYGRVIGERDLPERGHEERQHTTSSA